MALPRHARAIEVDGVPYRWLASGSSITARNLITAIVQSADGRGRRLRMGVHLQRIVRHSPDGPHAAQKTVVSAGLVRAAVRHAREHGWNPTAPGPDFELFDLPNASDVRFFAPADVARIRARVPAGDAPWCPIGELFVDLAVDRRPSTAWLRHWGALDADPLVAAWPYAWDPVELLYALRYGRPDEMAALDALLGDPMALRTRLDALHGGDRRAVDRAFECVYAGPGGHALHRFREQQGFDPREHVSGEACTVLRSLVPEAPTLPSLLTDYRQRFPA